MTNVAVALFFLPATLLAADPPPVEGHRTDGQKPPVIQISAIPDGRLEPFKTAFTKYVNVFGVHVFATPTTPDEKVLHAAAVLAEYLDSDEDGKPDNPLVVEAMASRDAYLEMAANEHELDRLDTERWHREGFHGGLSLFGSETNPGDGQFDASLEEVFHLITDQGYANAYPRVFGLRRGTELSKCLDAARGGHFTSVPRRYPAGAWFTYDDRTCDYRCQMAEYIYWSMTSMLGAQSDPQRRRDIERECRLTTRQLVKQRDPAIYRLLTDPKYRFPSVLPDGKYRR